MRAVVTGAAGFIGSTLTDRLLAEGHEVVAVDNFDDYYSGKMHFLRRHLENERFRLLEIDILDLDALRRSFEGADVVFHIAAQAGVRISVRDPLKAHHANTTGTLHVLLAARDAGVRRVINSSSSSVYGNAVRLPAREEDPTVPISPYAASKLAAEHYCRLFHSLYGLDSVSLRYFTVYGPRQRPDMAFHIFCRSILENTPITILGDGAQTRDFTFVSDIVTANRAAARQAAGGEIFNIGGGSRVSLRDAVALLEEIAGRSVPVIHKATAKGDVRDTWASTEKARQ